MSEYEYTLNKVSNTITFYFILTLLPLALCFNSFALWVLFSKKNVDKTFMIYLLKWQYIVDTILILNIIFNSQSLSFFSYSLQLVSDLTCRLYYLLNRFILHFSSWMQVIISLDRFMSIYLEKKLKFKRSQFQILCNLLKINYIS